MESDWLQECLNLNKQLILNNSLNAIHPNKDEHHPGWRLIWGQLQSQSTFFKFDLIKVRRNPDVRISKQAAEKVDNRYSTAGRHQYIYVFVIITIFYVPKTYWWYHHIMKLYFFHPQVLNKIESVSCTCGRNYGHHMTAHKILSNHLILHNISKYLDAKENDMIKFLFRDYLNIEFLLHKKVCKNHYCFCSHLLVINIA